MPLDSPVGSRLCVFPILAANAGGIYQYSLNVLAALAAEPWGGESGVLMTDHPEHPVASDARRRGWETRTIAEFLDPPARSRRDPRRIARGIQWRVGLGRASASPRASRSLRASAPRGRAAARRGVLRRWLQAREVALAYYLAPSPLACELAIPYVFTVHDLQHRLQPEFPEVSAGGELAGREYAFRNGIAGASAVVVDSDVGREDVLDCYADVIDASRIHVLPFCIPPYALDPMPPAEASRWRQEHRIPSEYLFYPAQFWPHKNHVGLVRALGLLARQDGLRPALVLSGSKRDPIRQSTFEKMMAVAIEEHVERQIHYLGFVEDVETTALYAGASAMVMPTFFGPTNIPVLEAWHFGCPVVTSDVRGIREQVGGAGLLVDPASPETIADAVRRILTDASLRDVLIARGRERVAAHSFASFAAGVRSVLESATEAEPPEVACR